jgi:hypothetical protein
MQSLAIFLGDVKKAHEAIAALPEDRAKVNEYIKTLDGKAFDITVDDIMNESGVRDVQGTRAFVYALHKKLLENKPR